MSDTISNYHDKVRLAPRVIHPFLEPHEALNFGRAYYANTADGEEPDEDPDQSDSESEGESEGEGDEEHEQEKLKAAR